MSPPRALIKDGESLSMLYLSLSESGGDQTRAKRRVNVGLDTTWRCSSVSAVGPSQVIISWHRQNRFLSWEYVRAVSFSPLRIRCIYADLIAKRIMGGFWNKSCSSGLLQNRTLQSILVTIKLLLSLAVTLWFYDTSDQAQYKCVRNHDGHID